MNEHHFVHNKHRYSIYIFYCCTDLHNNILPPAMNPWASIVIQNITSYMSNIYVEYDMSKLKLGNIQNICILIAAQSPKHAWSDEQANHCHKKFEIKVSTRNMSCVYIKKTPAQLLKHV
jgi:hypothetical protein